MLEDKLLVWQLKRGNADALRRIYDKYKTDLLALAISLTGDRGRAEDAVHDVFVSFAAIARQLRLRKSLKGYFLTSVANRVRTIRSRKQPQPLDSGGFKLFGVDFRTPESLAISAEQCELVGKAMAALPYDQREAIILRVQGGMKFKHIAAALGVSVNTAQSRYRYGLKKLQSVLNGEVQR